MMNHARTTQPTIRGATTSRAHRASRAASLLRGAALAVFALVLSPFAATTASAEQIPLRNGAVMQGDILAGQTSEETLALKLYETGGVVQVRWDHIEESRARELRVQTGVTVDEVDEILVDGHQVLLGTGAVEQGLALNPDDKSQPLKLRTASGERTLDRANVARITPTRLPGLLVYTPDDLYRKLAEEMNPQTPAAHKEMGRIAMEIGALAAARSHLSKAAADAVFVKTPDGRQLESMLRQVDLLEKAAGAKDMARQIQASMRNNRWNDAKKTLAALTEQYKDPEVRKLVGLSLLANRVVRGRDDYMKKEMPKRLVAAMQKMIEAKSRERKPATEDPDAPRGPTPGSLASARQWLSRELPKAVWDKVKSDLGIDDDEEAQAYWKARIMKSATAYYGTGSFMKVKKPVPAGGATGRNDPNRQRRPPGAAGGAAAGGPPQRQTKEDKPKTEEEWWEALAGKPSDRAQFLVASFVEESGLFEVLRVDESELCSSCGGKGVLTTNTSDGAQSNAVCTTCNGCGKFRKVVYR